MSQTIRILGIDPALRNTGLAVMDYSIETGDLALVNLSIAQTEKSKEGKVVRKSSDDLACARILVKGIASAILLHKPSIIVAEVPTGTQSARGAFSNGICCGVLGSITLPMIEVSPTEVKMATVGSRTASKDDMIQWAVARWPKGVWLTRKLKGEVKLLNDNEHMADACAAVVAGTMTGQFAQAVALMTSMRTAA
jgi:Holliday junction resolvasome RuvABC endonuclease subunit